MLKIKIPFKIYFPLILKATFFQLMIDFQAIHARHLQIFREFAEFRRKSVMPIRRAQARIKEIKRHTLQSQQRLERKIPFPNRKIKGQRVNLLI